jgi:hypothetical protein
VPVVRQPGEANTSVHEHEEKVGAPAGVGCRNDHRLAGPTPYGGDDAAVVNERQAAENAAHSWEPTSSPSATMNESGDETPVVSHCACVMWRWRGDTSKHC